MRDPRYDILFEPVPLGPVTARNRFFQVPHCNGMGHHHPTAHAHMRGVKAEGGWAVVCTEEVEIHPSSEVSPYIEGRLWDDADIPALARMTEKIHEHGSLAGIEPCPQRHPRREHVHPRDRDGGRPPAGVDVRPRAGAADGRDDIAALRRWHRAAIRRSLEAGFDVVYVYAAHGLNSIGQFLSRQYNLRTDGYGGSLENRARLLREMLEDTLDEVDGRAAVACRITVDELVGADGIDRPDIEGVLGLVGELPDVWDFVVGEWENDSSTSRFAPEAVARGVRPRPEGAHVQARRRRRPVHVARHDGADGARRRARHDRRRTAVDRRSVPAAEDRGGPARGHPRVHRVQHLRVGRRHDQPDQVHAEPVDGRGVAARMAPRGDAPQDVRRVRPRRRCGAGGLEAAMALGKRGHRVVLAEATQALGGRVAREARLPGLAEWIRVLDYRRGQLDRLPDVEIAYDSRLTAEEVLEYGFDHVAVATGCRWRADGVGRWHLRPIELEGIQILTPDDVMAGTELNGGRVVVYDDDHYYLGGVVAEALARSGHAVTFVTPAARVSEWTVNTLEQVRIQRRMLEAGIEIVPSRAVDGASAGAVRTSCVYTSEVDEHAADALVLVTSRLPDDGVAADLVARAGEWEAAGLTSVRAVGDALCPGTIAAAVWDGRRYAEQLGEPLDADGVPFLREIAGLSPDG